MTRCIRRAEVVVWGFGQSNGRWPTFLALLSPGSSQKAMTGRVPKGGKGEGEGGTQLARFVAKVARRVASKEMGEEELEEAEVEKWN